MFSSQEERALASAKTDLREGDMDSAVNRAYYAMFKSVGEGITLMPGPLLATADLLSAHPRPVFDVFSYDSYAAASERCATLGYDVVGTMRLSACAAKLAPPAIEAADEPIVIE